MVEGPKSIQQEKTNICIKAQLRTGRKMEEGMAGCNGYHIFYGK